MGHPVLSSVKLSFGSRFILLRMCWWRVMVVGLWEEKWGLKLASANVEVEVEAELGKQLLCLQR